MVSSLAPKSKANLKEAIAYKKNIFEGGGWEDYEKYKFINNLKIKFVRGKINEEKYNRISMSISV